MPQRTGRGASASARARLAVVRATRIDRVWSPQFWPQRRDVSAGTLNSARAFRLWSRLWSVQPRDEQNPSTSFSRDGLSQQLERMRHARGFLDPAAKLQMATSVDLELLTRVVAKATCKAAQRSFQGHRAQKAFDESHRHTQSQTDLIADADARSWRESAWKIQPTIRKSRRESRTVPSHRPMCTRLTS